MTDHRHVRRVASALALSVLLVAGACSSDGDADADADAGTTEPEKPHFTYQGERGPEHWGDLSEKWAACSKGVEQSPVDLTGAVARDDATLPDIAFDYASSGVRLWNNGHTVQALYEEGSSITVAGKDYGLTQLHFHARSEHTIDGKDAPLEVHLVHQAADESLAVVGVLVHEGADNPAFAPVMGDLPEEETEDAEDAVTVDGAMIDAAAMLPADRTFFHYPGSLTTPPCSEGVSWQVMVAPIEMSRSQIAAFTALYPHDARPVQPLGEREVEVSGP